jgi:hypothetical protein
MNAFSAVAASSGGVVTAAAPLVAMLAAIPAGASETRLRRVIILSSFS